MIARERRSSPLASSQSDCEIKSSLRAYIHTNDRKVTAPIPLRISIIPAPDRAFYLSSVSNNLVKPRTPRMGYGSREEKTRSLWKREREMTERRTNARSEKKGSTTCGALISYGISSPTAMSRCWQRRIYPTLTKETLTIPLLKFRYTFEILYLIT